MAPQGLVVEVPYESMFAARLPLRAWKGPAPDTSHFSSSGAVLWLSGGGPSPWLQCLREALDDEGRLWAPAFRQQDIPKASGAKNPWTFKPDDYSPLRWLEGNAAETGPLSVRELSELGTRPASLSGLVLDSVLSGLGAQATRVMLAQATELLPPGAEWLLVDANGGSLGETLRQLQRGPERRGEGRETVRSAQELRRLLEVSGLGISMAAGLAQGRAAGLRKFAPAGVGFSQLVLSGRRVGAPAVDSRVD